VVKSNPAPGHVRRLLRGRLDRRLGVQVRRPHPHHFGQGDLIYLLHLGGPLQQAGREAHHHDGIPPQSNGLVERAHRQLKEALKSRLAGAAWPEHFPWTLLGLRAAPKDESNISSAELVYGVPLVLPGEFLDAVEAPAAEFLEHMRTIPTSIPTRPLPPPASADPGTTPTGQLVVRAPRRDDAAAHAAVCWPIRGTGARGEDLPHPDREQGGQGVGG
jgi:hypothetical protein